MKKITMFATAALGAAVLMSSLAVAKPSEEQLVKKATQQQCKFDRKADADAFKETYGPKNAMRNCKKSDRDEATIEVRNASQECRAERSEDADAFKEAYGTNESGKNAFGKCVSGNVKAENQEDAAEFKNAAKACEAERDADEAGFNEAYGSNKNGKNAFGKCVSTKEAYSEDSV
jgi:membrane protein involved in colicin uptake